MGNQVVRVPPPLHLVVVRHQHLYRRAGHQLIPHRYALECGLAVQPRLREGGAWRWGRVRRWW